MGRGPKYLLQKSDQNTSWPKHLLTKIPPNQNTPWQFRFVIISFMYTIHYVISCLFSLLSWMYTSYSTHCTVYSYNVRVCTSISTPYTLLRSVESPPRRRLRLFSYIYKKCIMAFIVVCVIGRGVCSDGRFGEWSLRSLPLVGRARLMPS